MLPNFAKNSKVADALKQIRSSIDKLGENITYDATDSNSLDNVSREVTARVEDAENLAKIAKKLAKGRAEQAANDFNNLTLKSEIASQNVDENHNENAENNVVNNQVSQQTTEALDLAVELAIKQKGPVDVKSIPIETIAGLEFKNIDFSPKYRLATGTDNDARVQGGIERNADGMKVVLTYVYDGTEYNIEKTIDNVPKGFQFETKFQERDLEITQGQNIEMEFD